MSIFGGLAMGLGKGLAANQELMREQEAKQEKDRRAAARQLREDTLLEMRRSGAIKFIADPRIEALVRSQTVTPEQGVTMQMQQTTAANKPSENYRQLSASEVTQSGLDPSKQYQVGPKGKVSAIGGNGTNITVNTGGNQMPGLSKLGEGMTYLYDDDGSVKRDERGAPISAPIQGSKAANLAEETERKEGLRLDNATRASGVVTKAAEYAREAAKERALGSFGQSIIALNPYTDSAEVQRQVEVLKSNAQVENLNSMRASSPTGGALGSVTENELKMLSDKTGALDPSSPNFYRDLDDFELSLLQIIHGTETGAMIFEQTRKATPEQGQGAASQTPSVNKTNSGVKWSVE
jgi:hypothetical protein